MKKLKLKLGKEVLTKEQMKKISGGYTISCTCEDGTGTMGYCSSLEECYEVCDAFCNPD